MLWQICRGMVVSGNYGAAGFVVAWQLRWGVSRSDKLRIGEQGSGLAGAEGLVR